MPRRAIRTKIVCTLGSSGERTSVKMLGQFLLAGMDVARVNMSHSTSYATTGSYVRGETYEGDRWRMNSIRQASQETGIPVAILGDLQGPKVRCGAMADGHSVELVRGQRFSFWRDPERLGTNQGVSLQYFDQVVAQLPSLTNVWLSDGLIQLTVSEIDREHDTIVMQVEAGGSLGSYQGVIFKDLSLDLPQLTPKDEADLAFLCDQDIDFIALSYLRSPADVAQIRAAMTRPLPLIAKIETAEALANLNALLAVVDGAMVARGDLGARLPFSEIALVQKTIIERCNVLGLPVITATQMLDSMETRPIPTRAEVTDVANAILDGTDALMLSGETAKGAYPLEAIRTLVTIAARVEGTGGPFDHAGVASSTEEPSWAPVLRDPAYRLTFKERNFKLEAAIARLKEMGGYPAQENRAVADSIAKAASDVAQALGIRCILCPTSSGTTPRLVGRFRPAAWIIGVVEDATIARRLLLSYGILPLVMQAPPDASAEDLLRAARSAALEAGLLHVGELFLFTAGYPMREPGSTNLLKVHRA